MKQRVIHHNNSGSFGYFVGFIGAAVWYISQATGFWAGVIGFLKAIVWPGFLVYEALKFLNSYGARCKKKEELRSRADSNLLMQVLEFQIFIRINVL